MKTGKWIVVAVGVGIVLMIGCGKEKGGSSGKIDEQAMIVDEILIQQAADSAIAWYSSELKAALQAAITEGGPVNAIGVCNEIAPEIAAAHSIEGWYLERVTDKSRNANNQVDSTQAEILARFAVADSAPSFIGEWELIGSDTVYHFYRPIRVGALCLNCHGGKEQLAPDVAAKIAELYPDDMATGYRVGDLRGIVAVDVAWSKGKAHAEALVAGKH
ncbi:MAG: DUF3365 domain-containing protein [candidate division Zixibacteria bacterium]|nr:DUF3365 domain-containing protein [candidate division Zixibacteria bacterium]